MPRERVALDLVLQVALDPVDTEPAGQELVVQELVVQVRHTPPVVLEPEHILSFNIISSHEYIPPVVVGVDDDVGVVEDDLFETAGPETQLI